MITVLFVAASLFFVAVNCLAHVTMDVIKDRRTHTGYGHPYRTFWHVAQIARDSGAWLAGGFALLAAKNLLISELLALCVLYALWIVTLKVGVFDPFYQSEYYKDWCWFQDEYKFRLSLGALDEFLGFDRNPPKLTDEELDEIWREIIGD